EKTLINTLVQEGAIINSIPTANTVLWSGEFRLPIDEPITITDTYGYSRLTGASSISHKGTDFRASLGTPVFAMNSGTIRFTDFLRNYGNTIVIDHGLGLQTIYMHLSEINVETGDEVKRGDLIGKSGDTGYVLGPHLHLSIKIGGISIDPERFMALFGN
ncbi:MAG: M23 family metallopeptidase, partial [bacterium]|nr:M23 family metallopeptidase [bacterium]